MWIRCLKALNKQTKMIDWNKKLLYTGKHLPLFYSHPFCPRQQENLKLGKFQCSKWSLFKHNITLANSRRGETAYKWRRAKITLNTVNNIVKTWPLAVTPAPNLNQTNDLYLPPTKRHSLVMLHLYKTVTKLTSIWNKMSILINWTFGK